MPDEFSIEARSLQELGMKLRRAAERGRVEADLSLAAIGEAHKKAAKEALDGHSTSIPSTIKSEPLPGAHAVRLTAAGTAIAWAYEKGNKTNRRGKTFTHPVFGREVDPPVAQQRFPFFRTARSRLRLWSTKTITDGWKRGMRNAGIKVDD